jgi:nitrile hydratase
MPRSIPSDEVLPLFTVGDSVRVRRLYPRAGHIRTPFYLRGKAGKIFRTLGFFLDPQKLADGQSGRPPLMLYQVRFEHDELWTAAGERSRTCILADLFENWLEPCKFRGDDA